MRFIFGLWFLLLPVASVSSSGLICAVWQAWGWEYEQLGFGVGGTLQDRKHEKHIIKNEHRRLNAWCAGCTRNFRGKRKTQKTEEAYEIL